MKLRDETLADLHLVRHAWIGPPARDESRPVNDGPERGSDGGRWMVVRRPIQRKEREEAHDSEGRDVGVVAQRPELGRRRGVPEGRLHRYVAGAARRIE